MPERRGLVNAYACPEGHRTVTINSDDGTTPFMIRCRSLGCEEMAQSSFYRVDQDERPTHEWHRPGADELGRLDGATREHVERGGLLLRRIGVAALESHGYRARGG